MRSLGILLALTCLGQAEDWPEWRGKGRLGVWNDSGVLERLPETGLTVTWRVPLHAGYSGPSVSRGRVYVTDFRKGEGTRGTERILALDEATGRTLWAHEWNTDYLGLQYGTGPRATPTVDGDSVYALGATGRLICLDAKTGRVLWEKDFVRDFHSEIPAWGMSGAPVVEGNRLIAVVAGKPDAKVVAFDKRTGREIWRALSSDSEPGYSQPLVIHAGGRRQLILWHAAAISSLDPETGAVLWEHTFKITMNTPIATPVYSEPFLLVSGFFNGARLLQLDRTAPKAHLVWAGNGTSEIATDTVHALMNSPVIDGEYIYGICNFGQLRGLRTATGERVWESQDLTVEKKRNASAFVVRNRDRYFISNDRGELIIARLTPAGYEEISRTKLIRPTSPGGGRRDFGAVHWSHPAYANRHIVVRNDEEILRASLEHR